MRPATREIGYHPGLLEGLKVPRRTPSSFRISGTPSSRSPLSFRQSKLGPHRSWLPQVVHEVVWGSRFLTRHALAASYRAGRILLAGDAAHEHSPLGGQGMNLGIHDAIALGRAFSMILEGGSEHLLDAYAAAQRPVAQEVISTTNLLTKVATTNERLRAVQNVAVSMLDPLIRSRLA